MMMWRICLLALMPAAFLAQPDKISTQIAQFEAGVICAPPTTGVSKAPDTVAGTTHLIEVDPPFVSLKRRVPAVIGIGFGVKAVGVTDIEAVSITVSHPKMGDAGTTRQSYESHISGVGPSLAFYQFDFDYELRVGVWQIEARQGDTVLYRADFDVLPPAQVPELAGVCGFQDLLS